MTENKYARRKLKSSYISTIVSISLVLFMLGLLGTIILHARKLSDYVKENIQLSVILKDDARNADVEQFQKMLDASDYVKSTEYISKDTAAVRLQHDLGEDFVTFLGYNPLLASIDVRMNADYANSDSLKWIETGLAKHRFVKEVFYQKSLVTLVNENLKTISLVILVFSSMLFIVAIALINNTIRLSLYSKRFLIKSMQLVGATQGFIRKPFVIKSMLHGLYGALIASALLGAVLFFARNQVPELFSVQDLALFATLFLSVAVTGILISWISTYFAIKKYLKQKLEDLYF